MYIYDENEDDDNDGDDNNNHNLIKQKKDFLSRVDGKSGPMVAKSQTTREVHRGNNLEPPASPRCLFLFSLKLSLTQSAKY